MGAPDDGFDDQRPETCAFDEWFAEAGATLDRILKDPPPDPVRAKDQGESLDEALPEDRASAAATIERLLRQVAPYGTRLTHPRSWPFITVGPSTVPPSAGDRRSRRG